MNAVMNLFSFCSQTLGSDLEENKSLSSME